MTSISEKSFLEPDTSSKKKVLVSWSTGKDCAWTLHILRHDPYYTSNYTVVGLLTTFNETNSRVAMHSTRLDVARAQAVAVGNLPLWAVDLPSPCSNEIYALRMSLFMKAAKKEGITHIAYGDLWLADVRTYREAAHVGTGIEPLFPIWIGDPLKCVSLAEEMILAHVKAILVTIDTRVLDSSFCGRIYDASLLTDLPKTIDPCGEKGEFHTIAINGPAFLYPLDVHVSTNDFVSKPPFLYADIILNDANIQLKKENLPSLYFHLNTQYLESLEPSELENTKWKETAALGEKLCQSQEKPKERKELLINLFKDLPMERTFGHEVHPNIFLANVHALRHDEWLDKIAVDAIIVCAAELAPEVEILHKKEKLLHFIPIVEATANDSLGNLKLGVTQEYAENLQAQLILGADSIANHVAENRRIVVACKYGFNRSASVVLSYLMKYKKITLINGLQQLRSVRPRVYPNIETYHSLLNIERDSFISSSITEDELLEYHLWSPQNKKKVRL